MIPWLHLDRMSLTPNLRMNKETFHALIIKQQFLSNEKKGEGD